MSFAPFWSFRCMDIVGFATVVLCYDMLQIGYRYLLVGELVFFTDRETLAADS